MSSKSLAVAINRADLAVKMFSLRGEPLSFDKHAYMIDILNDTSKKLLMKCSRQVGKSTINSFLLLTDMMFSNLGVKQIRQLFVTPSLDQTKQFMIEKLRPLIFDSERFHAIYKNKTCDDAVFTQTFTNGAMIFLRAAFRDAERSRGIPADQVLMDEIQSMLKGNIPIIESCMGASPYARFIAAGTPLSEENQIEKYWMQSTQTEWVVPCHRHTPPVWNVLGIDNIEPTGLVCKKCKQPINSSEGRWHDMASKDGPGIFFKGFHVTQLGIDLNKNPDRWNSEIWYKLKTYPEDKFYNEVLGLSVGQADRPLSVEKLKKCCHPNNSSKLYDSSKFYDAPPPGAKLMYFGGIDWGEGREAASFEGGKKKSSSFTHFVIGAYGADRKFHLVFWKKFRGKQADPEFMIPYIINKFREWGITKMAVDWGFGFGLNSRLFAALGISNIMQCYHSHNLGQLYKFDPDSLKFILNRNIFISRLINDIKKGNFAFPTWENFKDLGSDFLSIYGEYNHNNNRIRYDHNMQEPDDGLHATLYAKFAADLHLGSISPD